MLSRARRNRQKAASAGDSLSLRSVLAAGRGALLYPLTKTPLVTLLYEIIQKGLPVFWIGSKQNLVNLQCALNAGLILRNKVPLLVGILNEKCGLRKRLGN